MAKFQVRPLTPAIGAVVEGADLSRRLDEDELGQVRAALLAHQSERAAEQFRAVIGSAKAMQSGVKASDAKPADAAEGAADHLTWKDTGGWCVLVQTGVS